MHRLIVFLAAALAAAPIVAETEIWLLSGPDCNICAIYDQVASQRGYESHLESDSERIPIHRADKNQLPPLLADHFEPEMASHADWPIQLTVAVVDDGAVAYAANIAESVDWSDGRIAERYMDPPAIEDKDALHAYGFDYAEYFLQTINLEYFVARARGATDLPYRRGTIRVSPSPQHLNRKRVSIWGAASQPAHNGLFISTRIRELIERIGREKLHLTYTNGPDVARRDTLVQDG